MFLSNLKSIPVLCYHKVSYNGGITPEDFISHLEFLKDNKYTTISARELYEFITNNKNLPHKPVVITFDDCSLDNWVYAIPLLNKYNFKGIFFAITSFIGNSEKRNQYPSNNLPKILDATNSFINVLKDNDKSQFMNENEIYSTVYDYGHEVYSHSVNHQMCFKTLKPVGKFPEKIHWGMYGIYDNVDNGMLLYEKGSAYAYDGFWPIENKGKLQFIKRSPQERYQFCLNDFKESKKTLENILNQTIDFFCWPWGHFDKLSMNALKEAGYKGSFTLERFPNSYGSEPFKINRILIGDNKSISWLNSRLKMYSNKITATIFFKKFKKKPELDNILFITDSNKFSSGGIRQLIYNIEALSKYNINIFLACRQDAEITSEISSLTKDIIFIDFNNKIKSAKKLLNFMKKHNISTIHTYHNKGHKLGVLSTILNFNRNKLFVNRGVLAKPGNILYYINPFINGFTCNSHKCSKVLQSRFISKKKINIIYNHIKIKDIKKEKTSDIPVICYIGNNNPIKGFDIFNSIISKINEHIKVKGLAVGIDKNTIDFNIDKNIEVIPETKNVFNYLSKSDIFMLTSRSESFPNVVLEAMMVGLPVLCSNVGAIPEIISNGKNGFICKSEEEFVQQTINLLNNTELLNKISEFNYHFIREKFDISLKGEKLVRLYSGEKIIDKLR